GANGIRDSEHDRGVSSEHSNRACLFSAARVRRRRRLAIGYASLRLLPSIHHLGVVTTRDSPSYGGDFR
ncbi:MAG: hypothetical protein ABGY24_03820, partial [bacterium]